jgi:hypothetical protein
MHPSRLEQTCEKLPLGGPGTVQVGSRLIADEQKVVDLRFNLGLRLAVGALANQGLKQNRRVAALKRRRRTKQPLESRFSEKWVRSPSLPIKIRLAGLLCAH